MNLFAAARAGATGPSWTASQIHDTVAAIAAEPKFARGATASLFGRFLRYLGDRLADLFAFLRGRADARWIVAVAILLVVVVVIARIAVERQMATARRRRGSGLTFARQGRTDYWALASEDAAAARYAAACHALYAAVLDALAREGAIDFHTSKTTGDYARELRRAHSPRETDFRAFVREFDRAAFGIADAGADDYARVRAAAEHAAHARAAA